MKKTNPDIDYGSALESLFGGLKDAEKTVQGDSDTKYAYAYGQASMAIKMCLVTCTDLTFDEMHKLTRVNPQPENDLGELFTHSKND